MNDLMSDSTAGASGEVIIEPAGQLDAVFRELDVRQCDDGILAAMRLVQGFPVPVGELWRCCTEADRLSRWFGVVGGDLRLGGRFSVEGNASGTVERCAPPGAGAAGELQLSWEFGEDVSQVELRCEGAPESAGDAGSADGAGPPQASRLVLEHRGIVTLDFWRAYGPGAGGVGWDLALLGLAHHLRTGSTVPAEQSLWVTTPAAAEFIAGSSDAWGRASEAAGTSPEMAQAAARRTTVFYTTPDCAIPDAEEPDTEG